MELKELLRNQAAGKNGEAKSRDVVFLVPVDSYMRENLIYIYHYTEGKMDYRDYDELSSDDIRDVLERWEEVKNSSGLYRLIAHLLEVDTWKVRRGSDA